MLRSKQSELHINDTDDAAGQFVYPNGYSGTGTSKRLVEKVSDPWFASDQQMYSARSLLYYVLGVLVLNMFIAWIWPAPW